jgi:hypothetical protein
MNTLHRFARRRPAWWCAGLVLALATSASAASAASAGTKAAPVAASSIFRACADALHKSSTSIRDDDGRQTLTVKLDGGRCAIDFRMEGKAQFNDDFTDIVSLSPGGNLRLDVRDDGERRQLEIEPGRDGLLRTWKVNGEERPYDASARAWFAAFLVELDRRTAFGVERRLPVLLRKGGVSAVLDETGRMASDYARGVYYAKLAKATALSNGDVVRVLDQTATMKTSDHYASEVLKSIGGRAGGAEVRAAMFRLIQSMSSDHYRAESVKQAMGSGRLGAPEMELLVGVIQRMESAHYKTEVLKQVLAAGRVDAAQRRKLALLARDIREDHYVYEFIKALAASRDAGPGEARAFIDAAATIQGDYYLSESIAVILADPGLTERDLLAIVRMPNKSDHYRSETLRRVLAHRAVTDAVRQAAREATGGMSSHYREEVEKASLVRADHRERR